MSELKDGYVDSMVAVGDMSREEAEARYESLHAKEIRRAKSIGWAYAMVHAEVWIKINLGEDAAREFDTLGHPSPYKESS